jgi:hypothetical protein
MEPGSAGGAAITLAAGGNAAWFVADGQMRVGLARIGAVLCLLAVAGCATPPDNDALIELHFQALTLRAPMTRRYGDGASTSDRQNFSGLQNSRLIPVETRALRDGGSAE